MKPLKKMFEIKKELDFINDRRSARRYEIMLRLNYSCPQTKYSGESMTKDISRSGLRFPTNSKLVKNAILDISIEDPNNDRLLSLKGRVAWLEEYSGDDDSNPVRYEAGVNLLKKRLF